MAFSTIPTAGLSTGGANFRNLIINGDMSIAQRTTSESSVNSIRYSACDRWYTNPQNIGTYTISQSTDVPTGQGFGKSYKIACTTADASPSASDIFQIQQRIEGQNLQLIKKGTSNAESITLSFWVKSNLTDTFGITLQDNDNSRIIGNTFTTNSANTWEKKTLTFTGDTTGALDNDNANSLQLQFCLGTGSTYSATDNTSWGAYANGKLAYGVTGNIASSTSNEFYITGVQLEVGTSASDFEFLPYDVNLLRCQRYLFIWNNEKQDQSPTLMGYGNGGSDMYNIQMPLPVNMRNNPSVSLDPGSGSARVYVNTSNGTGVDKNPFSFTTFGTQGNTARDGTCCLSFLINGFGGSLHSSGINSMYLRSTRMICDAEL